MRPRGEAAPAPPTTAVVDVCLRLGEALRIAPSGLRPITEGMRVAGSVLPARHYGSVDVFLEAFEQAKPGDVVVIDNEGRLDEACIGDLTVLEAVTAKVAGILVWGLHRDAGELRRIRLPVFSYGSYPAGPTKLRRRPEEALQSARFGDATVVKGDFAVADDDGAVFVSAKNASPVLREAKAIARKERRQADEVRTGSTLRAQFQFHEYLERRRLEPDLTFREHLRRIGGEIEQ